MEELDYDFLSVAISAGRKENYSHWRNYLNESKTYKVQAEIENNPDILYDLIQSLSDDEVVGIIRSFIVAEKFSSKWPQKEKNPAFILYKQLIRRSPGLRNELDAWVKVHTNSKCYLHYKLNKMKSQHLKGNRLSNVQFIVLSLVLIVVAAILALPAFSQKISLAGNMSLVLIYTVYALIAVVLFMLIHGFFIGFAESRPKKSQADDIFEMIEARKDRARSLGIPDLFGELFHKHLKFYPKWLAQGNKDKICPLISEITKTSDNDLNFMLNGHKYRINFIEKQMFSVMEETAMLRADFELDTEDEKVLSLKMVKEGRGYDSEWQVVDITAFKEADWLQDFVDLRERIFSASDKNTQRSYEEKVNKMKDDFGL